MTALVVGLVLVLFLGTAFARSRGVRIVFRAVMLLIALAATAATLAMLYFFVLATQAGKGDSPGMLLVFSAFPGIVAWVAWSVVLASGRNTDAE